MAEYKTKDDGSALENQYGRTTVNSRADARMAQIMQQRADAQAKRLAAREKKLKAEDEHKKFLKDRRQAKADEARKKYWERTGKWNTRLWGENPHLPEDYGTGAMLMRPEEGQASQANEAVDKTIHGVPDLLKRPDDSLGTGFETSQTPLRDEYAAQNPNVGTLPPSSLQPTTQTTVGDQGVPPMWPWLIAGGAATTRALHKEWRRRRDAAAKNADKGPYRVEGEVDPKTKGKGPKQSLAYKAGDTIRKAGQAVKDDFYAHSTDPNKNPNTRGQTGPAPKGGKDFTGKPLVAQQGQTATPPGRTVKGTAPTSRFGPTTAGAAAVGLGLSGADLINTYGDEWLFGDAVNPDAWAGVGEQLVDPLKGLVGMDTTGQAGDNYAVPGMTATGFDSDVMLDTIGNLPGEIASGVGDFFGGIWDTVSGAGEKIADWMVDDPSTLSLPGNPEQRIGSMPWKGVDAYTTPPSGPAPLGTPAGDAALMSSYYGALDPNSLEPRILQSAVNPNRPRQPGESKYWGWNMQKDLQGGHLNTVPQQFHDDPRWGDKKKALDRLLFEEGAVQNKPLIQEYIEDLGLQGDARYQGWMR